MGKTETINPRRDSAAGALRCGCCRPSCATTIWPRTI